MATSALKFSRALQKYIPQFSAELDDAYARVLLPDLIVVADDLGSRHGALIAPEVLEGSLFELYRLSLPANKHSFRDLVFHSDGAIEDLLASISCSGFTHIHFAGVNLDMISKMSRSARRAQLIPMGGCGVATMDDPMLLEIIQTLTAETGLLVADDAGFTRTEELEQFLSLSNLL